MSLSERTTASPPRKRGLRLAALLGAVPLVLSGIIGVAPSASADTAPVCPADTADTTWVLEGNVCVGTTTETTAPVQGDSTWACPEGFSSEDDPVTSESTCSKPVEPVYTCPAGYSPIAEEGKTQCHADDKGQGQEQVVDPESVSCPDGAMNIGDETEPECVVEADPVNTSPYFCPEGYSTSDDPVTSESTCTRQTTEEVPATCPVAGDVLTNIGDEEVANWQCITPATPATPIGGGGAAVFTASAASSGGVELCLVDGVTTTSITYDVTESATGPTPTDAQYAANVAAVDAVNASIAVQTPEGATLGACGAPIAEVPVVVSPVLPATVPEEPESVAVPQAATVPAAVPAGGGSEAPAMPTWALALALIAAIGGTAAASRLVTAGK